MPGKGGRPRKDHLAHRCHGTNAKGARCGAPAVDGMQHCRHHLSAPDVQHLIDVEAELHLLNLKAFREAGSILDNPRARNEDKAAIIRLVWARLMPTTGPAAVQISIGGQPTDPQVAVSDLIRERLKQQRAALEAAAGGDSPSAPPHGPFVTVSTTAQPDDNDVVDAVLVEDDPEPEPETVAAEHVSGVTKPAVPGTREAAYGVPPVRSRPFDARTFPRSVDRDRVDPPRWAAGL